MANLSQLRRQRMLAFLEKMREQHKDDDEVLSAINEVENEINEKKYGLVWEEHSEEVEERMVDEVPIFVEDKDKEITMTGNGYNFLLEGDNLHSLHLLEKTHKEKIDVIYIDPPYNTGNGDFIYDDKDKFVGSDDAFRHSKWLSFMSRRLRIAKNLLSNEGAIFISIGEQEIGNLRVLCDNIFGESNFLGCVARRTQNGVNNKAVYFSPTKDYLLAYGKCESTPRFYIDVAIDKEKYNLVETEDVEHMGMKYMLGESLYKTGLIGDRPNSVFEIVCPDGEIIRPPEGKHFKWSEKRFKSEYDPERGVNRLIFKKTRKSALVQRDGSPSNWNVYEKKYLDDGATHQQKIQSDLLIDSIYTNTVATKETRDTGVDFDYPKPTSIIKFLAELTHTKNGIILDFFAGSGTTGQAVLELNKEDGGNRHFILCTNNENSICENVTYQRIKTVMTGIRQDGSKYSEGIPADLKYYRTDFIPKRNDNLANDLIAHIDEMIQLEYGVKIDKEKYISILSDEDADELEKNWANYPNIKAIYISRSVLLTGKQRELFETHDCFTIPDYYFREELREAGEA